MLFSLFELIFIAWQQCQVFLLHRYFNILVCSYIAGKLKRWKRRKKRIREKQPLELIAI